MISIAMMRKKFGRSIIILFLTFFTTQLYAMDFFLTAEEVEHLRLSDEEWARPTLKTRGRSNGPVIIIQNPTLSNSVTPTLEASSP